MAAELIPLLYLMFSSKSLLLISQRLFSASACLHMVVFTVCHLRVLDLSDPNPSNFYSVHLQDSVSK